MRSRFDTDMKNLHIQMIEMGALCESGIANAVQALTLQSREDAHRAIELEEEINRRERDVEQLCYTLLLRQQPVARDLRKVSAAIKMVTDMERIGNQAADIAELALLGNIHVDESLDILKNMSVACISMVTDSIDAYVRYDTELAFRLIKDDDTVDGYFDEIRQALNRVIAQNPEKSEGYIDLLMCAKYLERIADHAVNIADWVIYIETNDRYRKGERCDNIPG